MTKINAVCIIDDDPITVFGIKKMLKAFDLSETIHTYMNGKLAIDGLRDMIAKKEALPEVIFLDINMPIMDGWQFLEEFITLPTNRRIRINIVTSSIDAYDRQQWESFKSRTSHTIDFRNKPIRKEDMLAITQAA